MYKNIKTKFFNPVNTYVTFSHKKCLICNFSINNDLYKSKGNRCGGFNKILIKLSSNTI